MATTDCTSPTTPAPNGATTPARVTCPSCGGGGYDRDPYRDSTQRCWTCQGVGTVPAPTQAPDPAALLQTVRDLIGQADTIIASAPDYTALRQEVEDLSARADAALARHAAHPVTLAPDGPALPEWQQYRGAAIRDGNGGWLVWRTNALPVGYYPAACPSVAPATARRDAAVIGRTGLTPAMAAEMTRDLAEMAVAS